MSAPRTETIRIAAALDVLARDIDSGDGVANALIAEASGRLRELEAELAAARAEALDSLEEAGRACCHTSQVTRDYNGQVAGTRVTDSGAMAVAADYLRRLAAAGRFRIVSEYGRMVVGYWPENDPQTKKENPA